jgi:hypothetical protein
MRLQTHRLWEDFWGSLHFYEHTWQNKSEFWEWAKEQAEADASSNETWITKNRHDEPWGPDNCRLVNIWSNSDFNNVLAGAFKQGGEYEYL